MKNHTSPMRVFSLFLILIFAATLSGQKIDSLKQKLDIENNDSIKIELLNYISKDYQDYYPDSLDRALSFANQALKLAENNGSAKGQYDALAYIGSIYRKKSEKEKSIEAYRRGIAIADSVGNKRKMLQLRGNLASAYIVWEDFEKALKMKYENIAAFEEMNDSTALMIEWYGVAHVHFDNQNSKEAIPMYYKALEFGTHPVILANLGQAYSMVDQYDSAFHYLNIAVDQVPEGSYNETDFLEILGTIYIEEKLYTEGIKRLEKALKNYGSDINLANAINLRISLTNAYLANNQAGKASSVLKAISKAQINELTYSIQAKYWRSTYLLNEKTGNYKTAFDAHKKFVVFEDSIDNNELRSDIKEIETKYETAKKEAAIKSLEAQNKIDGLQIQNKNRILWFSLGVLLTLLGLLYFIYKLYNQGKQKNVIITKALSEKELLLKEIHHRVKNNLQVVSSLLSLQSEYIKDDSALSALNEGRNRVRSMALIHQNLYSEDNLTGIKVKNYLEKLIAGLFDSYNINDEKIKLNLDIADLEIDVDTVIPLGLIANELVSNSLKHAFADQETGIISVLLHDKKDHLEFIVKDNGKGMDTTLLSEDVDSFGYQMITAFKEKLGAQMEVNGDDGTTVRILIKNIE